MRDKCIFIFEAENGMLLTQDVHTQDGHLVVPAGTILDFDIIQRISSHHIIEIYVEDPEFQSVPEHPSGSSYYDKIRAGQDFKQFQKDYDQAISDVKSSLHSFLSGAGQELDAQLLLDEVQTLFSNGRGMIHIFDMLHSMREFDDASYTHCINVALISTAIGKWLKFPQEDINQLTISGLLHDIGKLMIPDQVLNKPGKLSHGEYAIMKTHAIMGYKRLKEENLDPRVKEACLLHHERYDGSGYPFGLAGSQIPDFAQIVAIADVYDAMTASRVYRGSLCPFQVLGIMEADAFSKYNPRFIIPFLNNVTSAYLHNNVQLSDGRTGEVILINQNALSRPVVQCENDFVDLSSHHDIEITNIL